MSDVELGGATVFPLIGARAVPSKVCWFKKIKKEFITSIWYKTETT